jgi:hypothetical protein
VPKHWHPHFTLGLSLIAWHGTLISATLAGEVRDGATHLRDVEVMLVSGGNGVVVERSYTDDSGRFSFTVEEGAYHIGAFKHEYSNAWQRDLSVGNRDFTIRIEMEPKALADDFSADDCE